MAHALAIAEDARLLAASGRWSSATALIITAREEGGKGIYALSSGLMSIVGVDPQQPSQESLIKVLLRLHEKKQAFTAVLDAVTRAWAGCRLLRVFAPILAGVGIEAEDQPSAATKPGRPTLSRDELTPDPECMERVVKAAMEAYESEASGKRSETLRQRALYVEITSDGQCVLDPRDVGEPAYRQEERSFRHAERMLLGFISAKLTPEAVASLRELLAKHREKVQAEKLAQRAGE